MHAKVKACLENLRTEPARNSALGNFSNPKNLDRQRPLRTEKSPLTQKSNLGRQLLKSPDTNSSLLYSSRYNKSSSHLSKHPQPAMKSSLVSKDASQTLNRSKEVHLSSFHRCDAPTEVTERTTLGNGGAKNPVEAELTECLKRYMGGFSQYESSCVTTYCVNHQDSKTEFCASLGQLLIGFCPTCAVKFASQSLEVRPYAPKTPKMTKKCRIDAFLKQIGAFKKTVAQKRSDLTLAGVYADKLDVSGQRAAVEAVFEDLLKSLQQQKESYLDSLTRYWHAAKKTAEERQEVLAAESRFIDKIEADISDNYQSILDNVRQEDFDMILAHHQNQFVEREKLLDKLSAEPPRTMTGQLAAQLKEKVLAVLDEQMTAHFQGIELRVVHHSLPTFKNFSPQHPDKGNSKPFAPIPEEAGSEAHSGREAPASGQKVDSTLKNIPSIDNFVEQNPSQQVLTDSHGDACFDRKDSDDKFWEEVKGNCFLSVDPTK